MKESSLEAVSQGWYITPKSKVKFKAVYRAQNGNARGFVGVVGGGPGSSGEYGRKPAVAGPGCSGVVW
jgi:hypothetical protein